MVDTLPHRGPDSDNWGDAEIGIGLGHRRLAIVDLSATGRQPMISADGRYVITYNGPRSTIFASYGRSSKRSTHRFQGSSDTRSDAGICSVQ